MIKKLTNYFLLAVLTFFVSCTGEVTPEKALEDFVNYRFSESQTKDGLLERTTAIMSEKINLMTDEEFSKFIDIKNIRRGKFKIILAKCSEIQCHITYVLDYEEKKMGEDFFKIEMKKIAELQFESGKWKIADVSNLKTFYDSRKEIEITP